MFSSEKTRDLDLREYINSAVWYALFWFVSFSFLLAFLGCESVDKGTSILKPGSATDFASGDPAPLVLAVDLDGKAQELGRFQGKTVLLNFWATWCGPCVQEMPALERLYQELHDQNFEIVAVSVDDNVSAVREFVKKNGLSFNVWHDPSFKSVRDFRVSGFPETFVIDRNGKFSALDDPERRRKTVRFVADRAWDTEAFIHQLRELAARVS